MNKILLWYSRSNWKPNLENWSQNSGTEGIVALSQWCYYMWKVLEKEKWAVAGFGKRSPHGVAGSISEETLDLRGAMSHWGWVRMRKRNTTILCMRNWMCIFLWFFNFFFLLHFMCMMVVFRKTKWLWLPWAAAAGIVGESPRVLIAATFLQCAMIMIWLRRLRVCGTWAGERCWVARGQGFLFLWWLCW